MQARVFLAIVLTYIALGSTIADAAPTHHRRTTHYRRSTHHRRVTHVRSAAHPRVRRVAAATAAALCGGKDRWDVKDASDPGAAHLQPTIVDRITIAELNQLPAQALDADERMLEEKVIYRISGLLRLFKHDGDGDYHIVIGDDGSTPYSIQYKQAGHTLYTPASGHSIVVEVPDPRCIAGTDPRHHYGPSLLMPQLQESRADFAAATKHLTPHQELGARHMPITVTGVLFFDFAHNQTGHGLPHPSMDSDKRAKVVEIHPVLCNDVNGYRASVGKPPC